MAFDLYGSRPTGITQATVQRTAQGMGGAFSRTAAVGATQARAQYGTSKLGEAIDAWGADVIADWRNKSATMMQQLTGDLEEMRRQAEQARATNDMEMYQLAMDRLLFDKKMLAYAQEIEKNNTHSLIAGLVGAAGQILGGYLGSKSFRKQPSFQGQKAFYNYIPQL